jgi:hypothetical protein
MSSIEDSPTYLVCRTVDSQVEFALWRLAEGAKALALFLTPASAADFIGRAKLDPSWQSLQTSREQLIEILRTAEQSGITYVALDPDEAQAKRLFDVGQILRNVEQLPN